MTKRIDDGANRCEALVPAAGQGVRLGRGPKAFREIRGKSLLRWTVERLSPCVDRIIVGVPADEADLAYAEVRDLAEVIVGGRTRHETIVRLFEQSRAPVILIHDAARPFATPALFRAALAAARSHGSAAAWSASRLPAGYVADGFVANVVAKQRLGFFQTPLAFRRDLLALALEHARCHDAGDKTPLELLAAMGYPIAVVPDEPTNLKITTPFDMQVATKVLADLLDPASSSVPVEPIAA